MRNWVIQNLNNNSACACSGYQSFLPPAPSEGLGTRLASIGQKAGRGLTCRILIFPCDDHYQSSNATCKITYMHAGTRAKKCKGM